MPPQTSNGKQKKMKKRKNKKVTTSTSKEVLLSEYAKKILGCMEPCFGVLVVTYIKERLICLPEELQVSLSWHMLHYLYYDEIKLSGNPDVDTRLSEILEILPATNISVFRYIGRDIIKKAPKTSEPCQYAS